MAGYLPFLSGLALGLVLVPAARALGRATGLVDHPGGALKIHSEPVSVLGGVAVLASVVGALALTGGGLSATAAAAAVFGCGVGVIDDHKAALGARTHLLLQVTAGVVLALGGVRIEAFGPLGAVAVVALAVFCMNAVNLIDGQDGLAGGLVAIAAAGLAVLAAGGSAGSELGWALAGSLAAFLVWNRPPASIFLGNGGAYASGVILTVLVTLVANAGGGARVPAAALCLAVFGFELVFTVVRRAASGSITSGDRLHTYDLVAARIGSRGTTTLLFYALGALAAVLAVALDSVSPALAAAAAAGVALVAALTGRRVRRRPDSQRAPGRPSSYRPHERASP